MRATAAHVAPLLLRERPHLADQRVAVLSRQADVGEQEVRLEGREALERLGDRGRGLDLGALLGERHQRSSRASASSSTTSTRNAGELAFAALPFRPAGRGSPGRGRRAAG